MKCNVSGALLWYPFLDVGMTVTKLLSEELNSTTLASLDCCSVCGATMLLESLDLLLALHFLMEMKRLWYWLCKDGIIF